MSDKMYKDKYEEYHEYASRMRQLAEDREDTINQLAARLAELEAERNEAQGMAVDQGLKLTKADTRIKELELNESGYHQAVAGYKEREHELKQRVAELEESFDGLNDMYNRQSTLASERYSRIAELEAEVEYQSK